MKLVDLEKYGRERGYTIEKVANKKYEWYRQCLVALILIKPQLMTRYL